MEKKKRRGIKIQSLTYVEAVLGLALFLMVLYGMHFIIEKNAKLTKTVDDFAESQVYVSELRNLSNEMTENVRMYVLTQENEYMLSYFDKIDENNGYTEKAFLELVNILNGTKYADDLRSIQDALKKSNRLMEYEVHAMKLVVEASGEETIELPKLVQDYKLSTSEMRLDSQKKLERAYNIVYGKEYLFEKADIDANTKATIEKLSDELKIDAEEGAGNLEASTFRLIIFVSGMFVIMVVLFVSVSLLVIRPLNAHVNNIKNDQPLKEIGSYEFRYMARTYNKIYEANRENKLRMKFNLEHDSLTKVLSRHAFEEQKQLLYNMDIPMALLMIDVDYFKEINDNHGHEAGDEALTKIAETLKKSFRSDDLISRIGGDEFVVIMMNISAREKTLVGNKINQINKILQNPDDGIKTSISVGVAFSDKGYKEEMFGLADSALYRAKKNGKCGYSF